MSIIYEEAKKRYAAYGIDTEEAIRKLGEATISVHCWQGDDVRGFEGADGLTGGIQTTGNYMGRARTPEELMADIDKALSFCGGTHKLNLHACYAIMEKGEKTDRDALEPRHFKKWVEYAKARRMGLDFNPTLFSHPKAAGMTLCSADEEIRSFWVRHCRACIRISEYFANETGMPCVMNIWIPDGMKDTPADRIGPRARFKKSLDEILEEPYDREKVYVTLESKVFGIGLESYTAGSSEFTLGYAAAKGIVPLMDNGHYHPTEVVSDKISSLLLLNKKLALHITRGVRWDSDHVVRLDDETREIAKEIVASGRLGDIAMALDFFDAGINRIAAWVVGVTSFRKALLSAFLTPHAMLKELQDREQFTKLMVMQEQMKMLPMEAVWEEFCRRWNVPADEKWFDEVEKYEREVLSGRV